MAKFGFLKRIVKEEFKPEDQELVSKIAYIFNPAMESLVNALNRNLTFTENLNTQVKDLVVETITGGALKVEVGFQSELKGLCRGIWCIRAEDLTVITDYVTTCPFLSFIESGGVITIKNITGLKANRKYRLRIIAMP